MAHITLLFVVALSLALPVAAQVFLAPTAVYLSTTTTTTTLQVINPSTEDREIQLRLAFGYPRTQTDGTTSIEYADSNAAVRHSCAGFVSVYPKRFVLRAGQRQTVRVTSRADRALPDGVYWARLITSSFSTSSVAPTDSTAEVGTDVKLSFNQVIPVTYRHGDPQLTVSTTGPATTTIDGRSNLVLPINVSGNGAFVGTITCRVTPRTGGTSDLLRMPVSVYFSAHKRIGDLFRDHKPGVYDIHIEVAATKEDVAADVIAAANTLVVDGAVAIDTNGNITLTD